MSILKRSQHHLKRSNAQCLCHQIVYRQNVKLLYITTLQLTTSPRSFAILVIHFFNIMFYFSSVIKNNHKDNLNIICLDLLKTLTAVRPVIVSIFRENFYQDWTVVLKPDGNEEDTNALKDFAKNNNILGYRLQDLSPDSVSVLINLCSNKCISISVITS